MKFILKDKILEDLEKKDENNKICEFCGQEANFFSLCSDCEKLAFNKEIIKNEEGQWIKRERPKEELNFYDPEKEYVLKYPMLNNEEKNFFYFVRKNLNENFIITPQVNLQTIIETDTKTRNNELYRNLDFVIFDKENYIPLIAIEINGTQHYYNKYWRKRDKSVKAILKEAELEILILRNYEIEKLNKKFIYRLNNKLKNILYETKQIIEKYKL